MEDTPQNIIKFFVGCCIALLVVISYIVWDIIYNPPILLSQSTDTYIITSVNPPKHVYIDVKRISDNHNFHLYVSKHFNDYENYLWVGRKVDLTIFTYKREYRKSYQTFGNLRPQLEK